MINVTRRMDDGEIITENWTCKEVLEKLLQGSFEWISYIRENIEDKCFEESVEGIRLMQDYTRIALDAAKALIEIEKK